MVQTGTICVGGDKSKCGNTPLADGTHGDNPSVPKQVAAVGGVWVNGCVHACVRACIAEWVSEWVGERMREWVSE